MILRQPSELQVLRDHASRLDGAESDYDETSAVEPLDIDQRWLEHEPPDTYPSGL